MKKCFHAFVVLIAPIFSGCAIENLNPASVRPASALPGQYTSPNKQQRQAIMSGEKPDWRDSSPGPLVPRKK